MMSVDLNEKKKLNKTVIAGAVPRSKRYYITDTEVNGFALVVHPAGSKTYVFDYRMGKGRKFPKQRITIGSASKFSPEQAREKAKEYLAQVIKGEDPNQQERKKKDKHRFEEMWECYIEQHVKINNKPRTQQDVIGRGKAVILPYFKGLWVEDITYQDIHNFMLSKKDSGPVDANRCRSYLSKMFNLCERPWEIRPLHSNPCRGVFKYPEKRRDRYLSKEELVRLIEVLNKIIEEGMSACENKVRRQVIHQIQIACYFRLMLFTGARGVEWRNAKIDEVDIERMILQPETTKNDEPAISLPPEAIDIVKFLLSLPRPEENPYLFPGRYKAIGDNTSCMTPPSYTIRKILEQAEIKNFRPHDLRHSWAAFALASGLSLADVGQQLNHKTYQTTKRYEHLADKVKRKNVATVSTAIEAMSTGNADIIDIRTRKKT